MASRRIAVLPGDGIGTEVVPAALQVLTAVGSRHGLDFELDEQPWGCRWYAEHGAMMPPDALERLGAADAILLGAVGYPGVPDHVSLWGMLVPIRRAFGQYVNLRPARLLDGVRSPLRDTEAGIDLLVVRENTEGEYSQVGGRLFPGTEDEVALQEAVFSRRGISRVAGYAATLAGTRSGRLMSATKSNGIVHSMPFWDEVVAETVAGFPDVTLSSMHVDALAARMVSHPHTLDVVVASNLLGDVLTDLAGAVVGGLGLAPSANLCPEGTHPSMFEPVHGSAPDIAGTGVANPIGQVWSTAMMLDHLGHAAAAAEVMTAIESVLRDSDVRTPDLGGRAGTADVTEALLSALAATPPPDPRPEGPHHG